MQYGTKEFYDLRDQFEKAARKMPCGAMRFDKQEDPKFRALGFFYDHGETNAMFHAFMHGYAAAKTEYQQEPA